MLRNEVVTFHTEIPNSLGYYKTHWVETGEKNMSIMFVPKIGPKLKQVGRCRTRGESEESIGGRQ